MSQNPFILVVDDDAAVRRLIRTILEREDYCVLEASCAETALEIYSARLGEIELLISDVRMLGMDGNELVRRIRGIHPAQRVLFITGYSCDIDPSIGRFEELPKPFSGTELLRKAAAREAAAASA